MTDTADNDVERPRHRRRGVPLADAWILARALDAKLNTGAATGPGPIPDPKAGR